MLTFYRLVIFCAFLLSTPLHASSVPFFLEPYSQWIELQNPQWKCHFNTDKSRQCLWPGFMNMTVHTRHADFSIWVNVQSKSLLDLPGDDKYWPLDVRVEAQETGVIVDAAVIRHRRGRPQIQLEAGQYKVTGKFVWSKRPKSLKLPLHYAIVNLQTPEGIFWHRSSDTLEFSKSMMPMAESQQENGLRVTIYHRLVDGIPQKIETHMSLSVSGQQRVIRLPRPEPDFIIPIDFQSDLPVKFTSDNNIELQVKPGQYWIRSRGRLKNEQLEFKAKVIQPKAFQPWPAHEYWAYQTQPPFGLRVKQGTLVDATQIELPNEWRDLPIYRVKSNDSLVLEPSQQKEDSLQRNSLHLDRDIWLRFAGDQYVMSDQFTGEMRTDWRLNRSTHAQLQRVIQGQKQALLITIDPVSGEEGVELRQNKVNLNGVSRIDRHFKVAVLGWDLAVDSIRSTLHLPPGWTLFAVLGDRGESNSWVNRWTVWDLFLSLLVTILGYRVLGLWGGMISLGMSIFVYQTDPSWIVLWFGVLLSIAIVHLNGRWQQQRSIVVLCLIGMMFLKCLGFTLEQTRLMVYPQLEHAQVDIEKPKLSQDNTMDMMQSMVMTSSPRSSQLKQSESRPMTEKNIILLDAVEHKIPQGDRDFLQTGEGAPRWRWNQYTLVDRGVTHSEDVISIILLNPFMQSLWRLLSIFFIVVAVIIALQKMYKVFKSTSVSSQNNFSILPSIVFFSTIILSLSSPIDAQASSQLTIKTGHDTRHKNEMLINESQIIEELEDYLQQVPLCFPECAALESATLFAHDQVFEITLEIHSIAHIAVPLPTADDWQPTEITVNGQDARSRLTRAKKNGQILTYLQVDPGQSVLKMKGIMVGRQIDINVPLPIHHVSYDLNEWRIVGNNRQSLLQGTLQLEKSTQSKSALSSEQFTMLAQPQKIPTYLEVTRHLTLGVRWLLTTEVRRISPNKGFIESKIPLWPGESPITPIDVKNGYALIELGYGSSLRWTSEVEQKSQMSLQSYSGEDYFETWQVNVGPLWRLNFNGITPTAQKATQRLFYRWRPKPTETLHLSIQRPKVKAGASQSVEQAFLSYKLGDAFNRGTLELQLLSASPGEYSVYLDSQVIVDQATLNGTPIYDVKKGHIRAQLEPGEHHLKIEWQQAASKSFVFEPSEIQSSLPLANLKVSITPKKGQWILHVFGSSMGPAILFWSVLLVIIASAYLIYRIQCLCTARKDKFTLPMKLTDWFLLGVGTSTVLCYALAPVAIWLFALAWRGSIEPAQYFTTQKRFQCMQVCLIFLGLLVALLIIAVVPRSLLATPEMFISGNGSSAQALHWFQDSVMDGRITGYGFTALPRWVFHGIMLIWSLWLAHKVVQWIYFSVSTLQHKGWWTLNIKED